MFFQTVAALALIAQSAADSPRKPVDPVTLGPQPGAGLPAFELMDQEGRLRNFSSLTGPKGLVLVFFRSADW